MIMNGKSIVSDEDLIAALKKAGLMSGEQEAKYLSARAAGDLRSQALLKLKIDLGKAQRIEGELKNKSMPKSLRHDTKSPPRNIPVNYSATASSYQNVKGGEDSKSYGGFRELLNNPRNKVIAYGLAAVVALGGVYFGVKSMTGSDALTEAESRKITFSGVEENNWTSEKSRARHIKNLEGMLETYSELNGLNDHDGISKVGKSIKDYLSEVQKRDPAFYGQLVCDFDKIKSKFNYGD